MTMHILPDLEQLSTAAASRWATLAEQAISARGAFHVALTGGSTPRRLYEQLAGAGFSSLDWPRIHIYFGDERCVPPDHPDSNFRMADQTLLRHVPIPAAQIHRMRGEAADVQAAARDYANILANTLPVSACGQPQFDLVLLGLGEDGHVASLFPGTPALQEQGKSVLANYVEKLGAWRISLSFPVLDSAREVLMLVSGSAKSAIMGRVFAEHEAIPLLPVQMLASESGLEWYLDETAAASLTGDQRE